MFRYIIIVLTAMALFPTAAKGEPPPYSMTPEEVMKKSQAAFLYQGADFKARVMMKLVGKTGGERVRELTMIRKNYGAPGGDQKYFMYFFQPADVLDMTFMVYKYPKKDDDRWLFVPALNMVRRIAAQDKASSFVGSDFTYEDVSGRDIEDDAHEFATIELTPDSPCKRTDCLFVKSAPKGADTAYSYKVSYIDKATFLPLEERYYDKRGELYKVFTADEVKDIKGIPTVTKRTMKNLQSGHRTEVVYIKADYNIGVEDSLFSERFLRKPPKNRIE